MFCVQNQSQRLKIWWDCPLKSGPTVMFTVHLQTQIAFTKRPIHVCSELKKRFFNSTNMPSICTFIHVYIPILFIKQILCAEKNIIPGKILLVLRGLSTLQPLFKRHCKRHYCPDWENVCECLGILFAFVFFLFSLSLFSIG